MLKEREAADAESGHLAGRQHGARPDVNHPQEGGGFKRKLEGGHGGARGARETGRGGRGGGRKCGVGSGRKDGRPLGLRAARRQREQAEAEDFAAEYRMLRKAKKGRVSEAALDKVLGVDLDDAEGGSGSEGE